MKDKQRQLDASIPLELATLADIGDELDSRKSPGFYLFSWRMPNGHIRTIFDGMTKAERDDLLAALTAAHQADIAGSGQSYGRVGKFAFINMSEEHYEANSWRRLPWFVREAVAFLLACGLIAGMLHLTR